MSFHFFYFITIPTPSQPWPRSPRPTRIQISKLRVKHLYFFIDLRLIDFEAKRAGVSPSRYIKSIYKNQVLFFIIIFLLTFCSPCPSITSVFKVCGPIIKKSWTFIKRFERPEVSSRLEITRVQGCTLTQLYFIENY